MPCRMLNRASTRIVVFTALMLLAGTVGPTAPLTTELFMRGYSVIPGPRTVRLSSGDLTFGSNWTWETRLPPGHIAVRTLLAGMKDFHSVTLEPAGAQERNRVVLAIAPGTVKTGADAEIDKQAYALRIGPASIEVTGNAEPGLFYGVQTLVQLVKRGPGGTLQLPLCTIEDWPSTQLRFLHWDTKHHQSRIETLKSYLDWSARFKVNMIGFELEDKFEYPSHPVIGAPGAFTTAELQEIVNYGLERYIQVVPQIQSPAHLAYVLKHPEFRDLRSDGNNYQACLCDERTYKLIFSMYDDVIKATRGVDYFHASTDEVYYAGICAKCTRPYNAENRSLAWVEFANRAHSFLQSRGRKMLAWVEYPVLAKHIGLLPPDLINGVMPSAQDQVQAETRRGIRDLIYTSMQGEELLFPGNFVAEGEQGLVRGRLETTFTEISNPTRDNPIGVYGAAWDDSGLHSETFWLGWSTVAQYGWKPGTPSVEQHTADFINVFYGTNVTGMLDVLRGLQAQARFFDRSWDRVTSRVRPVAYGNSEGKGRGGQRYDRTLPAPALPSLPSLDVKPVYTTARYAKLVAQARQMAVENDILRHRLIENISRAERNRYSLEVFLSLAQLVDHHARLILGLKDIEDALTAAHAAALKNNPGTALRHLGAAASGARGLLQDRSGTLEHLKAVWEKSRFPKGREVNGRKFYHVMDDTKDHWADRRPDLSYMVAPEESIGLERWLQQLESISRAYGSSAKSAAQGVTP